MIASNRALRACLLLAIAVSPLQTPSPASAATPTAASVPRACDRYASPGGRDAWSGTKRHPVKTVQRLTNLLRPGSTGCLLAGRYAGGLALYHGGRPAKRITIRSAPGTFATLRGRVVLHRGAHDVTLAFMRLDAPGPNIGGQGARPSPTVDADRAWLIGNEITNEQTGICINVGNFHYGVPTDVQIVGNHIHNCGRLPATNHDHGIYVVAGRRTVIAHNIIHDNADRGIQLYPAAIDTVITRNVIWRNGEGIMISGAKGSASNGSRIYGNIIGASRIRANLEEWWPAGNPIGHDNEVGRNCVWGGAHPLDPDPVGFRWTAGKITRPPRFVDLAKGDFRLRKRSPCRAFAASSAARAAAHLRSRATSRSAARLAGPPSASPPFSAR